jgi:hypothetical protein
MEMGKKKKIFSKSKRPSSNLKDKLLKIESESLENSKNKVLTIILIGALSLLLYANTFDAGFVIDDRLMITSNNFTVKGMEGIKDIVSNDLSVGYFGRQVNMAGIHYRPIPQIIFALQYEWFGPNPMAGHVFNALAYALCCILLFLTLHRLLATHLKEELLLITAGATFLFIAHPIHTEVVANIKSLDEILALTGGLGAFLFSLKYYASNKAEHLVFAGLFFFMGILSKENALTFLFVIPLSLYLFRAATPKDYIKVMTPLFIGTIVLFGIRNSLLEEGAKQDYISEFLINPFVDMNPLDHLATLIYTWGLYLEKLIVPINLSSDYFPFAIPVMNWADWKVWLSLVSIAAIVTIILRIRKKEKIAVYGALFSLITFSLTSNLFFFSGSPMSERFMFTPSIGYCLVLSYVIFLLVKKYLPVSSKTSLAYILSLFAILVFYGYVTIDRNDDWADEYSLFLQDVQTSSESSKANVNIGYVLISEAGATTDLDNRKILLNDAEEYLNKAVSILPDNYQAYQQLSRLHRMRGDVAAAAYSDKMYTEIRNRLSEQKRRTK